MRKKNNAGVFTALRAAALTHRLLTAETLFHKDLVRFETGRYEVCLTGEKRGFTQKSETGAQIEYAAAANVPKFMEILKNNLSREDRRGGTNE